MLVLPCKLGDDERRGMSKEKTVVFRPAEGFFPPQAYRLATHHSVALVETKVGAQVLNGDTFFSEKNQTKRESSTATNTHHEDQLPFLGAWLGAVNTRRRYGDRERTISRCTLCPRVHFVPATLSYPIRSHPHVPSQPSSSFTRFFVALPRTTPGVSVFRWNLIMKIDCHVTEVLCLRDAVMYVRHRADLAI